MGNKFKAAGSLPLDAVSIDDRFWSPIRKLVKDVVIPYQWDALNDRIPDAEPSHAIRNFRIAAGIEEGEFGGFFFQDSDIAKWIEAAAYSLQTDPDPELESLVDKTADLIEKAQQPDGYLNTYFTVKAKGKRWTNLCECHELYTAGHFIEAGVAYFQATGKRKLLDIVCRLADHIDSVFGPEPGKLHTYDGHQEIELALARLYRATGEERYLRLGRYFIDERGKEPYYFDIEWEKRGRISEWNNSISEAPGKNREYIQAHLPLREQRTAVGHAVRLAYMLTGMADMAMEYGDGELLEACRTLWHDITTRQMYITGGIGATAHSEAFTFGYDLPNDTVYAETCASIGLAVFAQRMLRLENRSCFADFIERALYNVLAASMARDGKHFFYVNPLEVWPEASGKDPAKRHVKPVRQKWFGCACCPPNLARLVASLGQYIYTYDDDIVYVNQYIGNEASLRLQDTEIKLKLESDYPWDGKIKLSVRPEKDMKFRIGLRIPGWCRMYRVKVNGRALNTEVKIKDGYLYIDRLWKTGDTAELSLEMPVELMEANPLVRADSGKVAIQRGPVVYCLEETDNGANLAGLELSADSKLRAVYDENMFGGAVTMTGTGLRRNDAGWEDKLYRPAGGGKTPVVIKAVPYCMWGNRNPGEMLVWVRNPGV